MIILPKYYPEPIRLAGEGKQTFKVRRRKKRKGGGANPGLLAINDGDTVAWFDYTETSTITQALGRVSLWKDKLLSGLDLHPPGGVGTYPLLTATGIYFNGPVRADFLHTAALGLVQPETIYIVFKLVTWNSATMVFDGSADNRGALYNWTATPSIMAFAGTNIVLNSDMVVGAYSIVRIVFQGATSSLRVDAHAAVTGNFGAANMGLLSLGGNPAGGAGSDFEIKEIILRNAADSATVQTNIYNYLKTKHGL
jgi:hypothetical protein